MAIENEILVGRFNRSLQKLFGMKGRPPTPQLSSEIMPVVMIPLGVEFRFLETWDRFANAQTVAAVAANNSVVRLRNPFGTNVIIVIEKIIFTSPAALNPTLQFESAGQANFATVPVLAGIGLDPRGKPNPTLAISTQNTAAFDTGNTFFEGNTAGAGSLDAILTDDSEIPLLPNNSIILREKSVNTALRVSFMWRERQLEESERQ